MYLANELHCNRIDLESMLGQLITEKILRGKIVFPGVLLIRSFGEIQDSQPQSRYYSSTPSSTVSNKKKSSNIMEDFSVSNKYLDKLVADDEDD
jgi:hypothetical protein